MKLIQINSVILGKNTLGENKMSKEQKAKNLFLLQQALCEAKTDLLCLVQFYNCRNDGTILGTTDYDLLSYKDNLLCNLITAMNFIKPREQYHIRHCLNLTLTVIRKYSKDIEVNLDISELIKKQIENILDNSSKIVTNI